MKGGILCDSKNIVIYIYECVGDFFEMILSVILFLVL